MAVYFMTMEMRDQTWMSGPEAKQEVNLDGHAHGKEVGCPRDNGPPSYRENDRKNIKQIRHSKMIVE